MDSKYRIIHKNRIYIFYPYTERINNKKQILKAEILVYFVAADEFNQSG
jgi:hypothetical protein